MNKKNRSHKKKQPEQKADDANIRIPITEAKADQKEPGKECCQAKYKPDADQYVSRFSRFTVWLTTVTIAEVATFLLTAVIATSTTCYTIYSKKQWSTMQQQLTEFESVQAALLTFDISPVITPYQPGSGVSITWNPTITNAGSTVATEICVQGEISNLRGSQGYYGEPNPIPRPVPHPCPTGDTLPGGQHYSYKFGLDQIPFWGEVLNKESCLIVRWNVSYRDVFRRAQVSPYCYWFNLSENRFERCPPFTPTKTSQ